MDPMLIFYIVLLIGGLLYGVGAGLTEAAVWNILRRKNGKLITKNLIPKNGQSYDLTKIQHLYHTFRIFEMVGLFIGFLFSGYFLGKYSVSIDSSFKTIIWLLFFMVLISIYVQGIYRLAFLYERKQKIQNFANQNFSFVVPFTKKLITMPNLNWYGRLVLFVGATLGLITNIIYIIIG